MVNDEAENKRASLEKEKSQGKLQNLWNAFLAPELIQNLVASMPARCEAIIIEARGGDTKY